MKKKSIWLFCAVLVILLGQGCVKRISNEAVIGKLTGQAPIQAVKNAGEYVEMAELSLDRDNTDEALDYCKKALEMDPNIGEAYYVIGMANIQAKNYEIALTNLEKAVKLDPKLTMSHAYLGYVNYSLGRFEESIRQYDKVLKKAERFTLFLNHRGLAHLMAGNLDKAEKDFDDAVKTEADEPASLDNKALVMMLKGRFDEAETLLQNAVKLQPDFAHSIESSGIAAYLKRNRERAMELFREALSMDGSLFLSGYFIALIEKESGNDDESAKSLKIAISTDLKNNGEGEMVLKALSEKYPKTDLGKAAGRIMKLIAAAGHVK